MRGIGCQLFEILIVNGSERMVRRVPAALRFVPFEHRKINYPQKFEICRIEQLVPIVIFLRDI